jgi:hypothetical protein
LRELPELLELIGIEEGRKRVERRQHAADSTVEDGLVGIDRIHIVVRNHAVDARELEDFRGDVIGGNLALRGEGRGADEETGGEQERSKNGTMGQQAGSKILQVQYSLDAEMSWRADW